MTVLEGRVAAVTGAGRGLGRVEALELARLGARVVVSDLGTDGAGRGASADGAESVVEEILSAGGEAVAHHGDAADWNESKAMIEKALETWGDFHILVNNAGFCRDKMLFSMTEEDFDDVMRVHVKGHFVGMRHAAEYWRNKSKSMGSPTYGRIVSTSSEAFIFASVGQPNYAAAKAGIVALTGAAAQGLERYGVTANTIMPRARTRMTTDGPTAAFFAEPEHGFDTFAPEHVAPLVGYLASPASERSSGNVYVIWGRSIRVLEKPGYASDFEVSESWTYENVDDALTPWLAQRDPVRDSFIVPPA
ncbi:MAG: 3-oxoacyl-ACP reductase [Deltaproteobacteria bacterium]|nr:3-oxoacyl-ACP reductase [Deltaproteobacteria bacterium]